MHLEEFEDSEDDVVDVAEAGGLAALGVVEAAGPVDGDVVVLVVKLDGGADGGAGVGLAEGEEAIEDGAVVADVETAEGADLVVLGLGGDGAEEGDVVVGMEAAEVAVAGWDGAKDLHAVEETIVGDERVGHPDPVGLHRVSLPVVVVPHLRLVEVAHPPLRPIRPGHRRQRVTATLHNISLYIIPLSFSLSYEDTEVGRETKTSSRKETNEPKRGGDPFGKVQGRNFVYLYYYHRKDEIIEKEWDRRGIYRNRHSNGADE